MTRILVFLLPFLVLWASCLCSCAGDAQHGAGAGERCCNEKTASPMIICKVLEFSFCDVRPEYKKRLMIGPFRLYGGAEEYPCLSLLPPFCFSETPFLSLCNDGFADRAVAVYSDNNGFFREYSPCWRLRVVTAATTDVDNLVLEINYSYSYGGGGDDGCVTAMQRLPLRAMDVSVCGVGGDAPDYMLYRCMGDEGVPFSIVCICFTLHGRGFYPL